MCVCLYPNDWIVIQRDYYEARESEQSEFSRVSMRMNGLSVGVCVCAVTRR